MPEPLIGLRRHGAHGWTWSVHAPGNVSVWRTDETGHGLQRQVPVGRLDPDGRPAYQWRTINDTTEFALPDNTTAVLALLRRQHANRPPVAATTPRRATPCTPVARDDAVSR